MLAPERGGMSEDEPHTSSEAGSTLAGLGLSDLRPGYQPVVDLRDGRVVGYEALVRGGPGPPLGAPAGPFARARAPPAPGRARPRGGGGGGPPTAPPPAARLRCAASTSRAPARSRCSST